VSLEHLGWSPALADAFQPSADSGHEPGRVAVEHRGALVLHTSSGEVWADVPGRLRHRAASVADLPAVGDWVAFSRQAQGERATVESVLPRRTAFLRKVAGFESVEQVVAANVDIVFAVSSLEGDLNPRRLERYLTLAWESGAEPVVVLTKADLCKSVEAALTLLGDVTLGVPVHAVSAVTGQGIDALAAHLTGGRTATLVGSSGVGKSTLVNRLCGSERLATGELRADGRGRHTTTHRELVVLDAGGCLIDTPGMRELTLWDAEDGLGQAFEDVEELAGTCRFSDCAHRTEPGCAVRAAIAAGTLDAGRLESFRHLQRELRFLEIRHDARVRSEERKRWRAVSREQRLGTRDR
jgi:ribosome biogenesis GTPase / thiamine phosphate phosphatase